MKLKKFLFVIVLLLCAYTTNAQKAKPFDPIKFEADLEQFIATQAGLTPQESSRFFPVYREMRNKQRAFFGVDKLYSHVDVNDDRACAKAIMERDNNEISIKKIIRTYHNKFLEILPARKVLKVIKAEDDFHRRVLDRLFRSNKNR